MSDTPPPHTHRVTILVAAIGVAVGGYALLRADHARDRAEAINDRIQVLENTAQQIRAEMQAAAEREARARTEMQSEWQSIAKLPGQVQELAAAHEALRARSERPQRAWVRAEADYLIELAERRLRFDRDIHSALAALESADARLASLHDASLTSLRERLAKDIHALRGLNEPDRTGIIARLSALETQSAQLPLKGFLVGARNLEIESERSPSLWNRTWTAIGDAGRQLLSVRHLSNDASDIVSIEEQTLRREQFSLLAFAARQSVARADAASYRAALDQLIAMRAKFFAATPVASRIDEELTALRSIDIAPTLPTLSSSSRLSARGPNVEAP